MKYVQLGSSDLQVSECCLGTMTWGGKNSLEEGHEQIDYAQSKGVNFMDTAEMYAVPPTAKTYGATEEIIGHWVAKNPEKRKDWVIMTKMAGPGLKYVRNGAPITAEHVQEAIDNSLKRLQTDYIDVYQLHWPNRPSPFFNRHWPGKTDFSRTNFEEEEANMTGVLQELQKAMDAGKIRHWGLSNESAWGISAYSRLAKQNNIAEPISTQNEFSLINSHDWPFVIESCEYHNVAYLPWSPLGGGVLSGKYLNGVPKGSRWWKEDLRHGNFRNTPNVSSATSKYVDIAKKYELTGAQLANAWCQHHPWVTSTIIGASSMDQLKENLVAFEIELSKECLDEVNAVHRDYPVPY